MGAWPAPKGSSLRRIGCMNVRGCNEESKKEEIVRMMDECKLDVLALSETKVRGKGEWKMEGVRGYRSGGRAAKRGVAVLMSKEMWEGMYEHKEINERIMYVKVKTGGKKLVFVSVYIPAEGNKEERERYWEELGECIESFKVGEKVIVLGDMNAKVGDEGIEGVIGSFGVPGLNDNGECLIDMCAAREMRVGGTYFKKKLIHKYTWRRDNGDTRSMIDHVVVDREVMRDIMDVTVVRGAGGGISDHYLVVTKLKVTKRRKWRRNQGKGKKVLNVGKLRREEEAKEYEERMKERWEEWREMEVGEVEGEWEKLKVTLKEVAEEVCGLRGVGRGRKGTNWWNGELEQLRKEKIRKFKIMLASKTEESREEYKRSRNKMKHKVNQCKRESDESWGQKISVDFKENKKLFWRQVNEVRKPKEKMESRINDRNGCQLTEEGEVANRWKEYFDELLNVREDRRVEISTLGGGARGSRRIEWAQVSEKEIEEAVAKTKSGKAAGLDGVCAEMLKRGGRAVREWLRRVFNVCYEDGRVPEDWRKACIVPIYKGKGCKMECRNYRGISLLSIPGKIYGRIIIQRIMRATEEMVGEEQCSFRKGRGCVDQIFTLRQMCEKICEKGKQLYLCFVDLEKAYDRVDREGVWDVLKIYGVGGRNLKAVKSFYEGCEACVRVDNSESDMFKVKVGLRQGCVMSPWLFNLYMEGVMREVNARVMGKGVRLEHSGYEWRINSLIYADDTVLLAETEEGLRRMVGEFDKVCWRRKLKVNVSKSKTMVVSRKEGQRVDVEVQGERMEQVRSYRYLGTDIHESGRMEEEIGHRVREGERVGGALRAVWRGKKMSVEAMRGMYEAIVVPTVTYGSESWVMYAKDRSRVEAVEMRCLRAAVGVTKFDRVRNNRVRERAGVQWGLGERVEQANLRWYGHVMRMDESRYPRKVLESSVVGERARGRPRKTWMNGVEDAIKARGRDVEEAKMGVHDRENWRRMYRLRAN